MHAHQRSTATRPFAPVCQCAGCGKSHLVKELTKRLGKLLLVTATTGAAATLHVNGTTVHRPLKMSSDDAGDGSRIQKCSTGQIHDIQLNFADCDFVCVDEVSMMQATGINLFKELDNRLRRAFNKDLPFGGKSICFVGDFHQLPPVAGESLAKHVVESSTPTASTFRKFMTHTLHQQFRAADAEGKTQRDNMSYIRDAITGEHPAITDSLLDTLRPLSSADLTDDPTWRFAPILVADNVVREFFNRAQAIAFAKKHNKFVYTWRLPLSANWATATRGLATKTEQLYAKFPELTGYFVEVRLYSFLQNSRLHKLLN